MFMGLLLSLLGGSLVGLQGIFNNKVNDRAGIWATTTLVLGLGFLASLTIGLVVEGAGLFDLASMRVWYGFSGIIGVGVVYCVVRGIKLLGPTFAVSIAMASQLGFALLGDTTGWLGLDKVPFTINKGLGVLIIIAGIVIMKVRGRSQSRPHRQSLKGYDRMRNLE